MDGSKGVIFIGDALHHVFQITHPKWCPVFDWHQSKAVESRKRLMDVITDEGLLLLSPHFKFPGLGKVKKDMKQSGRRTFEPLRIHRPKCAKALPPTKAKKSLEEVLKEKEEAQIIY